MKVETQHLIIVGIVLIALALVFKDEFAYAMALATGLVGFIAPKTLNDKQSEILNEKIEEGAI